MEKAYAGATNAHKGVSRHWPLTILCIGIALSAFVFLWTRHLETNALENEFHEHAHNRLVELRDGLEARFDDARLLQTMMASPHVDFSDFRSLAKELIEHETGIQAMVWAPRVTRDQRDAFEETARQIGFLDSNGTSNSFAHYQIVESSQDGKLVRAGDRDVYYPIYYLQPLHGNEAAIGFDLASEKLRREALLRALNQTNNVSAARVKLLQPTGDQNGFLIVMPVYPLAEGNPATDRGVLKGYVCEVFRVSDVVNSCLSRMTSVGLDVLVLDATAPESQNYLFTRWSRLRKDPPDQTPNLEQWRQGLFAEAVIPVADWQWRVLIRPTEDFYKPRQSWFPLGYLIVGLFLTSALAKYSAARARAARDANRRKEAEIALHESDEQLARNFQDSVIGMTIISPSEDLLKTNGALCQILGYSEAQLLAKKLAEITCPEDYQALKAKITQLRDNQIHNLQSENRLIHSSGRQIWAMLSLSCARDKQNQPRYFTAQIQDITERKQVSETLQRYELLARNTRDIILFIRVSDGAIIEANDAAFKAYGYSRAELLSLNVRNLRTPNSHILTEAQMSEADTAGILFETEHVRKNGSIFPAEVNSRGMSIGGDRVLLSIIRDITERKQAEAALKSSQARLQMQFDGMPIACITINPDWKITSWNPAAEKIFGFSEGEILGQNFHQIVPAKAHEQVREALSRVISGGQTESNTNENITKDGRIIICDWTNTALVEADGTVVGIISMAQDVTDRYLAEEKIREQAALIDSAHDAITVWDLEGHNTFWNHGAQGVFGWSAQEMKGQSVEKLFPEEAAGQIQNIHKAVLERGDHSGELKVVTKGGGTLTVMSHRTLIYTPAGQPKSILSIDTNITDHKRIEAQFLRAQRMETLGTLVAGIAHDLNNILAPILMCTTLLRVSIKEDEDRELLDTIDTSTHRGAGIIKQLLVFGRGASGDRTTLNPTPLVKEIHKILLETFPKEIELRTVLPTRSWFITSSPTYVHQILMNLCVNSRDAMPTGGVLTITLANMEIDAEFVRINPEAKVGKYIVFKVLDAGVGIPESNLERIFDPFFTTKDVGRGTGLGLAAVLGITKSHGGFVTVSSQVGHGSEFSVYIPAAAEQMITENPPKSERVPIGRGEKVLIVDDEATLRTSVRMVLERNGYAPVLAGDGASALKLFNSERNEIAAVITDLAMPGMDGVAFVRALKKIDAKTKVLVCTGLDQDFEVQELKSLGIDIIVKKPFTAEAILKQLNNLIS